MTHSLLDATVKDAVPGPRKARLDQARALIAKVAPKLRRGPQEVATAPEQGFSRSERAAREDMAYAIVGAYPTNLVLGLSPRDARRLARYGLHVAMHDGYEAAKDFALVAVAADDGYVPACLLMGACLAREGQDRQALYWYERAKRLAPKDVRAYVDCGELKLGLGDYLGAAADFEVALKLDPDGKLPATRRAMSLVARTTMALS